MIERKNVVLDKSFKFAVKIYNLCKILEERREYILSNQILKSGTSIGANVSEATVAQTKKDFYSKMSIAFKESKETHYWLLLPKEVKCIDDNLSSTLINDCEELAKIIGKIRTTTRKQLIK